MVPGDGLACCAMEDRPTRLPEARQILDLGRKDKRAAEASLAALSLQEQVGVVCEAPVALRERLLELVPRPERVIPLLPAAELCFTAKAVGFGDASWILEHATPEQLTACVDLDAWSGFAPDPDALDQWLAAIAEAGDVPLLRTAQSLDAELLVRQLRERALVVAKPPTSEDSDDWQPPEGAVSLEGIFHLVPKRPNDDLASLLRMLHVLFQHDYWLYFRLLQGAVWELDSDLEEWALRWRTGRLEDLGFPSWDEAMRIYGFIRPERRAELPAKARALDVSEWHLPVWMTELPAARDARHAVFRGAAELRPEERHAFFYAFVSLANKVAVADRMDLADAETLPQAIEKAARVVSRGLELVAGERQLALDEVLRRVGLERLFRVGASLDPERARPRPRGPSSAEESGEQESA
jgi:hypothetical protein